MIPLPHRESLPHAPLPRCAMALLYSASLKNDQC